MAENLKLALKISIDGAGQVRSTLQGVSGDIKQVHASASVLTNSAAAMKSALTGIGGALAGIGVAGLARQYTDLAIQQDRLRNIMAAGTGGVEAGARAMATARDIANRYGLELVSTAEAYGKLAASARGTALEGEQTARIFASIAKASANLSLTTDESAGALTAISQMMSKGKVSAEELRGQLGERLPGAFQVAARAMGVTTAELDEMLKKGEVVAADFLPRFAAELDRTFSKDRFDGAVAEINRLKNSWLELQNVFVDSGWVANIAQGLTERLQFIRDLVEDIKPGGKEPADKAAWQYMGDLQKRLDNAMAGKGTMQDVAPAPAALPKTLPAGVVPVKAKTTESIEARGSQYDAAFAAATEKYRLPAGLLKAVAWQESKFNPAAKSYAGAQGMMQFMPGTAQRFGLRNPFDPLASIDASGRYFEKLFGMYRGDPDQIVKALASYNAGEGNVQKFGINRVLSPTWAKGQTRDYVAKITGKMGDYAGDTGGLLAGTVDLGAFDAELKEAEAQFKETLARMTSAAEASSAGWQETIQTQAAGLDAWLQAGKIERELALQGKEGGDRVRQLIANAKDEAAELTAAAEARARIQNAEITVQQNLLQARIAGYQKERAHLQETGAAKSEMMAVDRQIAESQGELARLDESRQRIAIETASTIAEARATEAQSLADARAPILDMIKALQEEGAELRLTGEELDRYRARKEALAKGASGRELTQIEDLIRANAALRKAREQEIDFAKEYEQAWIQATRNIQNAVADLFTDILTGQTKSLEGFLGAAQRATAQMAGNNAALALREVYQQVVVSRGTGDDDGTAVGAARQAASTPGAGSAVGAAYGAATSGATSFQNVDWGKVASKMAPVVLGAAANAMMPNRLVWEGQPEWMQNSTTMTMTNISNQLTDMLGDLGGWFALFKLVKPAIEGLNRLAVSLYPDRKQSTFGWLLGGPIMASLLGDVVKSGVGLNYSTARGGRLQGRYEQNGAPIQALETSAGALGQSLDKISRNLGIDIPQFIGELRNRGPRMDITGYEPGGREFYKSDFFRVTDINVEGQLKLFMLSILQRQKVLKQFDDFLQRGAISVAKSLDEVTANMKRVGQLRAFEGKVGSNAPDLGQIWKGYTQGRDTIADLMPDNTAAVTATRQKEIGEMSADLRRERRQRIAGLAELPADQRRTEAARIRDEIRARREEGVTEIRQANPVNRRRREEVVRLNQALGSRFADEVREFRDIFAEFKGDEASGFIKAVRAVQTQMDDLRASDRELVDFAKRSKGLVKYEGLSEADFAEAEKAAFEKVINDLMRSVGTSVIDAIQSVQDSIASLLGEVRGSAVAITDLSAQIGAGLASLSATWDPESAVKKAGEITDLIMARYALEEAALRDQISAVKDLQGYIKGLTGTQLDPRTWRAQQADLRTEFEQSAARVTGGDRSGDAIREFQADAAKYLEFSRDGLNASQEYINIFNDVTSQLNRVAADAGTPESDLADLQRRTLQALDDINRALEGVKGAAIEGAQAQIAASAADARAIVDATRKSGEAVAAAVAADSLAVVRK